jgi:MFS family permease
MTALRTPSAPAPATPSPRPALLSRSGLVTFSGIVVAILPSGLLATALMMMPDTSPVWSMFERGNIHAIAGTSIFFAALALGTVAGIAIANRSRGWRVYSGTMGWFFVILSPVIVGDYLQSLEFARYLASSGGSRGMIIIAAAVALLGILLLVAKRDEPPLQPALPMSAIGIVAIAIGIAGFAAAAVIYASYRATATAPAAIGGAFALLGFGIVMRGPGWRIYTGCLAWFLIVTGIVGFLGDIPGFYDPRWLSRMWENASTAALCIGIGYFILWSKRREPRRPPEQKDAAAA